MGKPKGKEYWKDIFEKLSRHNGSIAEFCRKHNIRPSTLYTRKNKMELVKNTVFQEIKLNEPEEDNIIKVKPFDITNDLKIEIGKAKIYFSNINNESLTLIIKEVIKTC
jgi:hypothetical protein